MRKKKVRRYLAGGKASGPGTKTSDSILARLSNGEYVLPAESVAQVGLPTLEALRQQGLATRALRAGAPPGYAMGGFISDSQIMDARAKADPLDVASGRFDRENPMTQRMSTGMQFGLPNTGFLSDGTNSAMDAYRQARSSADPLDVASGRFDRGNPLSRLAQGGLPRYAEGGMVGKAEWNRLPRFANGSDPSSYSMQYGNYGVPVDQDLLNRAKQGPGIMDQMDAALKRNIPTRAVESPYYGAGAESNTPNQKTPVAPTAASVPATPGNEWGSLQGKWGIERPRSGTLPEMPGTLANRPPAPSPATQSPPQSAPFSIDHRDRMGMEQANMGSAMQDAGYAQLPGTDTYRRALPAPGGFGETTYSALGVPGVGGGNGSASFMGLQGPRLPGGFVGETGTPETRNMTQAQATAYNVANLDRQTEALRSRNEAFNAAHGIGARAFGDLVSIGTPGGNFGDEAMRQQKILGLLSDAGRKGIGATRRKAILESAQQMAALPQPPGVTRLPAEQGQPGIDPYKLAQLNMDQQKFGLDQRRFAQEQNNASYDQALKDQQLKLHAFLQAPEALQKERMDQIQAAYYQVAQAKGPDSPEAKKLAAIMQTIHGAKPQLDLTALMQQQKP